MCNFYSGFGELHARTGRSKEAKFGIQRVAVMVGSKAASNLEAVLEDLSNTMHISRKHTVLFPLVDTQISISDTELIYEFHCNTM